MTKWRFANTAEDGEAWLRRPSVLQIYVDYEPASASGTWRRVMVVTKSWLENHMRNVKHGTTTPLWAGLPPMIIVPDANGEDLRRIVDSVIQQGGMDLYSEPLNALPTPVE